MEHIRPLGLWDIRKGVTLWRLGCSCLYDHMANIFVKLGLYTQNLIIQMSQLLL